MIVVGLAAAGDTSGSTRSARRPVLSTRATAMSTVRRPRRVRHPPVRGRRPARRLAAGPCPGPASSCAVGRSAGVARSRRFAAWRRRPMFSSPPGAGRRRRPRRPVRSCRRGRPVPLLGAARRAPRHRAGRTVGRACSACRSLTSSPSPRGSAALRGLRRRRLAAWLKDRDWAAVGVTERRLAAPPPARAHPTTPTSSPACRRRSSPTVGPSASTPSTSRTGATSRRSPRRRRAGAGPPRRAAVARASSSPARGTGGSTRASWRQLAAQLPQVVDRAHRCGRPCRCRRRPTSTRSGRSPTTSCPRTCRPPTSASSRTDAGPFNDASCPLKVYEYLAAGLAGRGVGVDVRRSRAA